MPRSKDCIVKGKAYLLEPGDATRYSIVVTAFEPKGEEILESPPSEYVLVTVMSPMSCSGAYPFCTRFDYFDPGYVYDKLCRDQYTAGIVAAALPGLVRMQSHKTVLDLMQVWLRRRGG